MRKSNPAPPVLHCQQTHPRPGWNVLVLHDSLHQRERQLLLYMLGWFTMIDIRLSISQGGFTLL